MSVKKFYLFIVAFVLLMGGMELRVAGQGSTATILGTVSDASSSIVPEVMIQVTNTGTGATQSVSSDAQGRYRVPTLPIGSYDVQAEKAGFQTSIRKGITLSVGEEAVVDFALTVGQVSQTVTVEGELQQVETTSSAVSNLIEPTQMRELPLNGRNFEQLILLSPGVTIHQAIGYQAVNGTGSSYSVAGSRTRGQAELLDGNDIMNWQGRNSGSGVLGTQLGVDAIAEFNVMTNTYSAQYGGNGAVISSVTRSGTNALHGSGYEFARNQIFDAKNYYDPAVGATPPFSKNQFGGTIGGPIKKDKMFFFFNYEGIRQNSSPLYKFVIPDEQAHYGFAPVTSFVSAANPVGYSCVNKPAVLYDPNTYKTSGCQATIPANVLTMMNNFPLPNDPGTPIVSYIAGSNGLLNVQEQTQAPGTEHYLMGRYDWTISTKDSMFSRYLRDAGQLYFPYSGATLASAGVPGASVTGSAANGNSLNQYVAVGERHIASSNLIFSTFLGYVRTFNGAHSVNGYGVYNYGQADLWSSNGISSSRFPSGPQGSITILPLVDPNITLSQLGSAVNFVNIQNKYQFGEDVYWTKGAHSTQFGFSIARIHSYGLTPNAPGSWVFANVANFLTMTPTQNTVICNPKVYATCASLGTVTPVQHFRENDYGLYFQDDWHALKNVTFNLGLRYSPQSNPSATGQLREWINLPLDPSYDPTKPYPGCTAPGPSGCGTSLVAGTLPTTPVSNVFLKNITLHNFEPRIGLAWDIFGDHKTSLRAGYGIFHSPILPYDYSVGSTGGGLIALPYVNASFTCANGLSSCPNFPVAPSNLTLPLLGGGGISAGSRNTPYMQQYNLTIQRQVAKNTVVSIGYVGSHGVHLIGQYDMNPPLPTGDPNAVVVCPAGVSNNSCNIPNGAVLMAAPAVGAQLPGFACGSLDPATGQPAAACPRLTAPGPIVSANGQPILDTATGQYSYGNVIFNPANGNYTFVANRRPDPLLNFSNVRTAGFWSRYNSLQAQISRRMTNNLQFQAAYTYGICLSNSSGTTGFENGMQAQNSWNLQQDKGNCGFLIRHEVSANGTYLLPFKGNRLVEGWQLSTVYSYHTGSAINFDTGWASGIVSASSGPQPPRPNIADPNCQVLVKSPTQWFNPACFSQQTMGEPGNVPFMSSFGPDFNNFDMSLVKNTNITERFKAQFRFEVFNVFNRVNFRNPAQPSAFLYSQATHASYTTGTGTGSLPATCFNAPTTCSTPITNAPVLFGTNGNPRQMQFGIKVTF